jgi:hypothetical protein
MSSTVISHSEVDSFLLCEQRHYYAFGDNDGKGLEPKIFSDSLYRGIVGHKALEIYFKALMEGSSLRDAADQAITTVQEFGLDPQAKYEILTQLSTELLPRYFEEKAVQWMNNGWKVKAVEKTYRLEVPIEGGTLIYPFTPDLIIADPFNESHVVDHKFIYNFYAQAEIDILPQIPKYVGSLRALGKPVKGGIYNMLRWRPVKDQSLDARYRTTPFVPTDTRVKQAFSQQVDAMVRIRDLKEGDNDSWKRTVNLRRVQNNMICKSCSFKTLCTTEMNGGNGILMRQVNYQVNSYGYSEVEADA